MDKNVNEQLAGLVKEIFGLDIEEVKKKFDENDDEDKAAEEIAKSMKEINRIIGQAIVNEENICDDCADCCLICPNEDFTDSKPAPVVINIYGDINITINNGND